MAFAKMYIGDSQTMAAEAAVLGTPSIRFNDFVGEISYLEELEHKYQLTFGIRTSDQEKLFEKTKELIEQSDLSETFRLRKEIMLKEKTDLSIIMKDLFLKYCNA
jgi:predicted glycosyltransferase